MAYISNFKFCSGTRTIVSNFCQTSSPIQTVSSVNTWAYDLTGANYFQEVSALCCHSAAIKADGTLWLWGNGLCGRIGNNSQTNHSSPVQTVSATNDWKSVSIGTSGSAAIKTDGTLWAWGSGVVIGNNSTVFRSSPTQTISATTNWKQVWVDDNGAAAVKTDGTLWLWGTGNQGKIGNNSTVFRSSPTQTVSATTNWKQVSTGRYTAAAVKTDGTLWAWGNGSNGFLGNNSTVTQSSPVQTVSATTNWSLVAVGYGNMAAIKTDGTLWLWGCNGNGDLGNISTINRSSPVQTISNGTNWKQVALGRTIAGAVKTDGTLWMWGCGYYGRLGNESINRRSSPVQTVSATTDWSQVRPGSCHVLAAKTDGTLWGWGSNVCGLLGTTPTQITTTTTLIQDLDDVFVRRAQFTDGGLWTWGCNGFGQLGNNSTINRSSPVQTLAGGTNWRQVETHGGLSDGISGGIKTDGTLWMWGGVTAPPGSQGSLGNNSSVNQSSPVQTVAATTNWKSLSLSCNHAGAVKTDGTLWMWGSSSVGQLGNNSTINRSSPVQTVSATTDWRQVSLGTSISAATKIDGTLWLWGCGGSGQLGNNSTVTQSSPVQTVSATTNWRQVDVGLFQNSAVKTDGTLWLWGCGAGGVLGNNLNIEQSSPVQTVSATTDWRQVSVSKRGPTHTAAIKTDGTLWTWGTGIPALGDNVVGRSSPGQTVSGGNNWKCVRASGSLSGVNITAAIKTDGTLWLWGNNTSGTLGNDLTSSTSSPIQTVVGGNNWLQVTTGIMVAGIRENCW